MAFILLTKEGDILEHLATVVVGFPISYRAIWLSVSNCCSQLCLAQRGQRDRTGLPDRSSQGNAQ